MSVSNDGHNDDDDDDGDDGDDDDEHDAHVNHGKNDFGEADDADDWIGFRFNVNGNILVARSKNYTSLINARTN